ncbi:terminase small subunit [Pseudoxanthobacter sp. M-2]|uniref:terminase small subunit n=1 Tax=Pseudoxanthobacter sp. M-2 TaxID=3078754 RepID=UPI0038FBE574
MSAKLTPRQARFVQEYLVDLNATRAAIRAGYSPRSAETNGNRMLRNAQVAAAVEAAMAERQIRTEITADRVIRELAKIAFLDPRKFFRPDGSLVPIHELDDDTAAGLAALDIAVHVGDDGDVTKTAKIKIADKRAALVDLGKHLGLFDPKRSLGTPENPFLMLVQSAQGTSLPIVKNPPSFEEDHDWPEAA